MKNLGKIRVEVKNTINGRWMPHATYRDSEQGEREARAELDRLSSAGYAVRAMASGGDWRDSGYGGDGFHSSRWPSSRNRTSTTNKRKRKRNWLPITL